MSLCGPPILIHLPASHNGTCRLLDIHLAEQPEDNPVHSIKFSEDGSLLAIKQSGTLCMWKTSAWEHLWSVPCEGRRIMSHDSLQVIMDSSSEYHAHDARSGDRLGGVRHMPRSMHDHVHTLHGKVGDICDKCETSLLKNGEYWFTFSDSWLWVVEEGVARRLIHFIEGFWDIKAYSVYVAVGTVNGLLVLNTTCNSEVV